MTSEALAAENLPSPLHIEQLRPLSASQLIFETYNNRIAGMAGFKQRDYTEAKEDFDKTILDAVDGSDINLVRSLLHAIIEPESYEEFKQDIQTYWKQHSLESKLQTHSIAFLTNHRFFSDLPVTAGTVFDLRQHDPYAASRNILVVGKLIPCMSVNLLGDGNYYSVTPTLSMIARQIQTVPGLPKGASEEMEAQRLIWNEEAKAAIETAAATPGHIIFEAASGTHDEVVEGGKKLIMKSVNPETARLLCDPRLIVVPLYFSCNSFSLEGLRPATANYRLLEPRTMKKPEDVLDTMRELATAGSELLADEFPNGVEYDSAFRDKVQQAGRSIVRRFSRDDETDAPY